MAKIDELKQRGAALVQQAREIQDNPKGENGRLTPEQITKRDNLLNDAEAVRQEAQTEERMAGVESWVTPEERGRRLPVVAEEEDVPEEERQAAELTATDRYGNAFEAYARRGDGGLSAEHRAVLHEARALTEGLDADGGYLAPEQLVVAIEREAQDIEQLAPRMDTINTTARRISFNREADSSLIEWGWVAELQRKPESQPRFDRYAIDVHTAAGIIRISDELLEDAQFNLVPYLAVIAAERKVMIEETAYLSGTGVGQPFGILTRINAAVGAPQRYLTQNIGAITGDDFIRILYALSRSDRRNASFVVGSQMLLAARLLKAGDNYVWQPGLQAGEPDRIIGKPVIESPDLALDRPVATGNDVALCGDLRRYRILRRLQMQVKRLEELYAATDEVGFRHRWRVGGDVRTLGAFRSMRVR